ALPRSFRCSRPSSRFQARELCQKEYLHPSHHDLHRYGRSIQHFLLCSPDRFLKVPPEYLPNRMGRGFGLHFPLNQFIPPTQNVEAAAAGILEFFGGTLVHDCWSPYFSWEECLHALCNAHLLRELRFFEETG